VSVDSAFLMCDAKGKESQSAWVKIIIISSTFAHLDCPGLSPAQSSGTDASRALATAYKVEYQVQG
jgi:hypothetical protein